MTEAAPVALRDCFSRCTIYWGAKGLQRDWQLEQSSFGEIQGEFCAECAWRMLQEFEIMRACLKSHSAYCKNAHSCKNEPAEPAGKSVQF